MKENLLENAGVSKKELRKIFVEGYLLGLKNRRPIEVNKIATVLHGQYAHQGLMVVGVKEDGDVSVLPTPESDQPVDFKQSEIWDFDDYHNAFKAALDKYKFTTEELGVDIPDSMNN